MKRLRILADPNPIEITYPAANGPYPYLRRFGDLRLVAVAGHLSGLGDSESPSLPVTLANPGGKTARLIGQPLRVPAEVWDDEDDTAPYFAGLIQSIVYGQDIDLIIEA